MRAKYVGNKADSIVMNIRNKEASATIPIGSPVVLNLGNAAVAGGDGLDVVLPSTANDAHGGTFGLKYGIALGSYAINTYGESILFGYCANAIVVKETRSATSGGGSWSTMSQDSGVGLGIDSVNNAFTIGASVAGSVASNILPVVLLDTLTMVASATTTADSRTAITSLQRVFVRML